MYLGDPRYHVIYAITVTYNYKRCDGIFWSYCPPLNYRSSLLIIQYEDPAEEQEPNLSGPPVLQFMTRIQNPPKQDRN